MPDIKVVSAQGVEFTVQFHQQAYKCWHVLFPSYVDGSRVKTDTAREDYTYTGPHGGPVLASSSLERAMSAIADHICNTEY